MKIFIYSMRSKATQHFRWKFFFQCLMICPAILLFNACTFNAEVEEELIYSKNVPRTTYQKYLFKAQNSDPKLQNLIGYMLYYGEGVKQDYEKSHQWFHTAAELGETGAQRNLGLFHARVNQHIPEKYYNPIESNEWFSKAGKTTASSNLSSNNALPSNYFQQGTTQEIGKKVYQTFCAGCHGFKGIAAYKSAPSFSKGERLNKSDNELLKSISDGKNLMPGWRDILPENLRHTALLYIRSSLSEKIQDESIFRSKSNDSPALNIDDLGAQIFSKYCAGCHGFNGIAYYVNSPSFALGQRMEKSDATLKQSINKGRTIMPSWEDKISHQEIDAVLIYIRKLESNFDAGIERELNQPLGNFYRFQPSSGW